MTPPGLRKLLLVAVSVTAALAAAEWFLRSFFPLDSLVYALDERTGFRLVPGARRRYQSPPVNGGGSVLVRIDRHGFRGPGFDVAATRPRVVVYGDSFVAAEYSQESATFVARLGARLGAAIGTRVEALNAGVTGYGPDQVARRLETELEWLHPDLVVVVLYAGNDFTDLVRNKLFRLGPRGELVDNTARVVPLEVRHLLRQSSWRHPRWWMLVRYGRLAQTLTGRWWRAEPTPSYTLTPSYIEECLHGAHEAYDRWIVQGDETVPDIQTSHWAADVALSPDAPSAVFSTRLLGAVMRRIAELASKARTPVLVVVPPSGLDATTGFPVKPDPELHPEYRPERLSEVATTQSRAAGLPVLDLWKTFQQSDADTLYRCGGDDHWNDRGQDVAAERTVREILERRLLEKKKNPGGGL